MSDAIDQDAASGGHSWSWPAFLYLSGEMDPTQRTTFEADLELHQEAREALAREVELSWVVASALQSGHDFESDPVVRPPALERLSAAVLLPLTVAVILIAAVWLAWSGRDPNGAAPGDAPQAAGRLGDAQASQLAALWADQAGGAFDPAGEDPWAADAAMDREQDGETVADDDVGELDEWMLVAVEGLAKQEQ